MSKLFYRYNVHILLHLADSAKKLGPLQNHSAYKTENELGLIIKMNKCKNNYAALEISSKYCLQSGLRNLQNSLKCHAKQKKVVSPVRVWQRQQEIKDRRTGVERGKEVR